jgi:hypothetical protein
MNGMRQIFSNFGLHDEGAFRDAAWFLSVLYSQGSRISAVRTAKILGRTLAHHPAETVDLARTVKALCMFLGDKFNNYIGELTPEQLDAEKILLGRKPSGIVMDALRSGNKDFTAGIIWSEDKRSGTLETAERLGIISRETFFNFANLAAKIAQDEQRLALELKRTQDQAERSKIREAMVTENINFLIVSVCMTSHIVNPHPEIAAANKIDMDMLLRVYPDLVNIPKGLTLSYSNVSCVNRILREMQDDRIEPDPVIAILERDGRYTDELKQQVAAVAGEHVHQKTIPLAALPQALQSAMRENQARIMAGIRDVDHHVQKALAACLAQADVLGGASNRIARVKAHDAGILKQKPRRL